MQIASTGGNVFQTELVQFMKDELEPNPFYSLCTAITNRALVIIGLTFNLFAIIGDIANNIYEFSATKRTPCQRLTDTIISLWNLVVTSISLPFSLLFPEVVRLQDTHSATPEEKAPIREAPSKSDASSTSSEEPTYPISAFDLGICHRMGNPY